MFSYNRDQGSGKVDRESKLPIEDIRLSASVIPQGEDLVVSLSTTARLDRPELGVETLVASVDSKGYVYLTVPMQGRAPCDRCQFARRAALHRDGKVDVAL